VQGLIGGGTQGALDVEQVPAGKSSAHARCNGTNAEQAPVRHCHSLSKAAVHIV
jgi:hypothetical protein